MTPALWAAIATAAVLAGILLVAVGIVGSDGPSRPDSRADGAVRRLIGLDLPLAIRRRRLGLAGAALFAVVVGWLYSGIPTVGVVAGLAIAAVPWLFGATRAEKRALARIEAVEIWTRRLADLVRAGGGLHQAILVSTSEAPAPIAEEVAELAGELRGDVTTWDALRRFADRLADPTSDEVIAALMLNASQRGPRLADVLDRVSDSMSDLITMRREVSAGRTDARLSGQILAGLTLAGLFLLLVNRGYMRPYHTLTGQIVLACCVATFVVLLTWMRHLNTPRAVPRLLRARPRRSS